MTKNNDILIKKANPDAFRAFFAIDLPNGIKKTICDAIKPLQQNPNFKKIRWIKQENLHLTLCFLGNITKKQYQTINYKIEKALKNFEPFNLELKGLQLFPSTKKPIAIAIKPQPTSPLKKLAAIIKNEVATCKIKTETREFKPHITIARLNRVHDLEIALPATSFQVTAVKLFKSEPQPEGSVYTPVAVYQFSKNIKNGTAIPTPRLREASRL